jgi:hypothetical protein
VVSGEGAVGLALVGVVGGGVLVASRLAVGATGLLGSGLAAVGDRSDAAYQRWQHDQQVAAVWECAGREVVDRNARIAVLRAHGADDPAVLSVLPTPFVLNGQPVDQLREWVAAVDKALVDAEEAMAARARRAVRAFLGSVLADVPRPGAPGPRAVHAEEAIARFRALREAGTPGEPSSEETLAEVARILDRLAADVGDDDRAHVLAAASAVVGKRGGDRHSQLEELRVRVSRANTAAKGRREGRRIAAVYLQALERSPESSLRGQLADVVAGRRDLGPALDAAAVAECDRVRAAEELAYVRDRATVALEALGYSVDPAFTTHVGDGERLRLVRDDWTEHAVGVVLDGDELRTSVLRTAARDGDDAVRVDAEREQEWCAAFDVLRADLADAGLEVEVTHLTHPGERPVPVAAARPKALPGRRLVKEQSRDGRR